MLLPLASLASVTAFIAALIGLVAAIGGLVAIPEYRRRLKAQRAELDTQLAQLFAELVPIANGYGVSTLPDAALVSLVENLVSSNQTDRLPSVLQEAYVTAPVGAATQAAAISSIVYLGSTYESLARPAEACLTSLQFPRHPALEKIRRKGLKEIPPM